MWVITLIHEPAKHYSPKASYIGGIEGYLKDQGLDKRFLATKTYEREESFVEDNGGDIFLSRQHKFIHPKNLKSDLDRISDFGDDLIANKSYPL